ncbi:anion permease|nr:anion permease [Candidatus Pantoea persica]
MGAGQGAPATDSEVFHERKQSVPPRREDRPDLIGKRNRFSRQLFLILLVAGLSFAGFNLFRDVQETDTPVTSYVPFFLLGLALVIALGFEFVRYS